MKTKLLFILMLVSYSLSSQTALNFDGVNDYVSVPNGGALNNLQTGTIELWVKWNSTTQDQGAGIIYGAIMGRQNDNIGNNQVLGLNTSNPNTAKIIWNPYLYTNTVLTSTSSPMLNTWVHIAIVYSSGDHKMYINGNLEATSSETGVIANNTVPLTLGAWIDDGVSYSNSYIDEFRVWNTIRTDAEILNTYDKCLTGTENGLVTLWQFEEGTGNTVTDLSGNGYNGTLQNMSDTNWVTGYSCEPIELVAHYPFNGNANDESGNGNHGTPNGATLTTDRFGNTDSAYSFDGSTNYISIPDNPNINVQTGESFTISYWTKHNAQNNGKYMISKYNGSIGVQPSYALGTGSNGDSYSWFEFTAGNGIENRGNIDLNDTNWHNITTVFKSGESVSIYVDGVLDIQHPAAHSGSISQI